MFFASSAASAKRDYVDDNAYLAGRGYDSYHYSEDYLYIVRPENYRLKVFYLSGHAGYMMSRPFEINDGAGCTSTFAGLFCDDATKKPLDPEIGLPDRLFVTAGVGFNTSTTFRFDAEWFKVIRGMDAKDSWTAYLNATSMLETLEYTSKLEIEGATVNMYLDLVSDRSSPEWLVVPYLMGGIGRSTVKIGDIKIERTDGTTFEIAGRNQKATTFVLGAGFSIGINSYVAFDVGYRFYDFGKVNPAKQIKTGSITYPTDVETELKAHVATLGLRLQI
jgi:opacity protein-like surface antigen